ncbi:TRAP transporter small permease [Neoroseomonas oryzicola]|uniref:TRAP transporter small permease protein n=1 Tax=Neoroseomonas oryzicola TaxID=535904 RepID=A0A9X9WLV9_9PROT|nr:TRAP transporter small permease [Neoroseomonas oryzicola]MBR0661319.1 TRAP transporter small permease [Neoroseomonas oryzicola]NKE18809.1 TRAP transporter small permease [Neoroseomonas oryzicola]
MATPRSDDEELFVELTRDEAEAPEPPVDMAPEDWLSFLLFWALAGIVFLQFFSRYILNDSIAWTEEIARYVLMALTFTGSAMAARRGTHIAVEFLPNALPPGPRRWMHLLAAALTIAFYAVSVWLCWQVAEAMRFQPMVVIDWPLSYVYWAILFGLVLTTLRAVQAAWRRFRAGEPAEADPTAGVHI